MAKRIHTLLIANRSEVAARIQSTAQQMGIKTVCVYAQDDTAQEHLATADAIYPLSGAGGSAYLNQDELIAIARKSGANAIHPGYGFLSEVAGFAEAVRKAGLIFVGPATETIALLSDKGAARDLAASCGIPLVPGASFEHEQATEGLAYATTIGFPVLLKATGGGGGRGMARINNADEFNVVWQRIAAEGIRAFCSTGIVVEKFIERPRHIEVQIAGDGTDVIHLFERDCSTQRRRQKIIEEAPAANLATPLREQMLAAAVKLGHAARYQTIGTVEFMVTADQQFYFLEVNTRLQVEHGVTELITGIDLVKLQLTICQTHSLPYRQHQITQTGHAIQCRIYAEDPTADFTPATGTIFAHSAMNIPFTRVSHSLLLPHRVSGLYDPMLSKTIGYGPSRNEALVTLQHLLRHYRLSGITTNIAFLQHVLAHPLFSSGQVCTQSIDELLSSFTPKRRSLHIEAAAVSTALAAHAEAKPSSHEPPPIHRSSWKEKQWQ